MLSNSLVDFVKIELGKMFKYPCQRQCPKANSRIYFKEVNWLWKSLTLEKLRQSTIIHNIFKTNSIVFMWNSAWEKLNFCFPGDFTTNDKIFISGGGLSTRQNFYDVLRFSWFFITS